MSKCPVCALEVGVAQHCSFCGASWAHFNLRRVVLWFAVVVEYWFLATVALRFR